MARKFTKGFYKSKAWQNCRNSYAKSVGHLCEICLKDGIYKSGEIVHHIIELSPDNINNPNITLNWNNLQLVCRECHSKLHGKERRYIIDEYGRVSI